MGKEASSINQKWKQILFWGLSLSGLLSTYITLNYPEVFSYSLNQSCSFWWKHEWFRTMARNLSTNNHRYWLSVGNKKTDLNVSHPPFGFLFQGINQVEGVNKAIALLQRTWWWPWSWALGRRTSYCSWMAFIKGIIS